MGNDQGLPVNRPVILMASKVSAVPQMTITTIWFLEQKRYLDTTA